MNLLAHLLLSPPTPASWVGNLMGDFVKGTPQPELGKVLIAGVKRHRAIDAFTDTHPVVRESKRLFSPQRRRFAGIILDVGYDYFLCRHWQTYSEIPVEQFIPMVYSGLADHLQQPEAQVVPPACRYLVQRMIADDWLRSYQTLAGVGATLDRLSRRLKRHNTLQGAEAEVEANEKLLDEGFQRFFPDLVAYVASLPQPPG
ncbi:MAG: ACP phosphodiesterase [Cyanobacteria bacterium P01_A01_bin.135]